MLRAHVETLKPPSQMAEIQAAVLDSPRNKGLTASSGVMYSGWILRRKEDGEPLELIIESETGETRVPLDVDRPDVISRVLNKASDKRLRCGFKLTIEGFSNTSLYIASNGRRDLWAKIYFVEEPLETIAEKLNYFMKILVQGPLQDDQLQVSLHNYALTDAQERREIILNKLETINPKGFAANIEPSKRSLPESFFEELKNIDAFSRFIETATKDGKIIFRDVFTKDNATCSFSYISDNNVNLLFFEGPSEPFIILQHVTYADVIFFLSECNPLLFSHIYQTTLSPLACQTQSNGFAPRDTNAPKPEDVSAGGFPVLAVHTTFFMTSFPQSPRCMKAKIFPEFKKCTQKGEPFFEP